MFYYGSLEDESYYVEINEETNVGYVVCSFNDEKEIVGTCTVIIINEENPNGYEVCTGQNDTLGIITIVITDEITSTGYVSDVTDELVGVFTVNEQVSFEG